MVSVFFVIDGITVTAISPGAASAAKDKEILLPVHPWLQKKGGNAPSIFI
jgi:hypothetical protein